MRIMLDTNILISMLLFPNEQFKKILDYITRNHKLVLSSFIISPYLVLHIDRVSTAEAVSDDGRVCLKIPNEEIRTIFGDSIVEWFRETIGIKTAESYCSWTGKGFSV